MPSFLTTELVKFNAKFCDIDLEMPAFDFCILFLEECQQSGFQQSLPWWVPLAVTVTKIL